MSGCKGSDSSKAAGDQRAHEQGGQEHVFDEVGAEPAQIDLLEPGSPPGRALAYQPGGDARKVTAYIELSWPDMPEVSGIAMKADMDWRRGAADATGKARHDLAVARVEPVMLPDDMIDDEKQLTESIIAAFGHVAVRVLSTAEGQVSAAQTRGLSTSPSLPALVHAAVVPFPRDPVGPGARWRFSRRGPKGDALATEERVYELLALTESGAKVRVTGKTEWSSAGEGIPELSMAAVIHLEGELEVSFSDPLPLSGQVIMTMKLTSVRGMGDDEWAPDDDGPGTRFTFKLTSR